MSVIYNSQTGQYSLHTKSYSYIMQEREGFLVHLYWGKKTLGDCTYMFREQGRAAFSPRMEGCDGFILDDVPLEYPCWGRGDMRSPALEIKNSDGSRIVDLNYVNHTVTAGKPMPKGLPAVYCEDDSEAETLTVLLADKVSGKYNIVCANIVADVIIRLLPDVGNFMTEDGILIVSGIIDIRKDDVLAAVHENGFKVEAEAYRDNWCAFVLKK